MRTIILTLTALSLLSAMATAQNELELVGQWFGEGYYNYFGLGTTFGDFNNDGYEEFLVGASGWNYDTGKNYLYFGGQTWPTEPFLTIQGENINENYDVSDQNVGDVNGDGIDDFGIAVFEYQIGRLDLYWGSDQFDTIPDWQVEYDFIYPFGLFGAHLDSLGDVNGDGGKDFGFVLDEMSYIWPFDLVAWIFWGGEVLDTIPDWQYMSAGIRIDGLGDVNGDGFADIMLLGNIADWPPRIFFGGSPMDTIPDLILYDHAALGKGGGVGDVNGDGYNDFCLPMHLPDSTGVWDCLYFGGPDVDDIPDVYLLDWYGGINGSVYGVSCGDFNGDGISDIVSTTGYYPLIEAVQIYLGSPWFNPVPDARVDGLAYDDFGETLSSGDVNGDGRDELLISAINDASYFYIGRVELYTGPTEWVDYGAALEPEDLPRVPGWYKLDQNFPNPFNASTTIHFELGKLSTVNMTVFDLQGNKIRELIKSREMRPGGYNVSWSGKNEFNQPVSSGIYVLELHVDQFKETRKMVLIR